MTDNSAAVILHTTCGNASAGGHLRGALYDYVVGESKSVEEQRSKKKGEKSESQFNETWA